MGILTYNLRRLEALRGNLHTIKLYSTSQCRESRDSSDDSSDSLGTPRSDIKK